jgi:hypothetical protein
VLNGAHEPDRDLPRWFLRGAGLGRDVSASARLGCAAAALVAQGLGSDHGDFSLAEADAFAESTPTL